MICIYIEDKKEIREAVWKFYQKKAENEFNGSKIEIINFPSEGSKINVSDIIDQINSLIISKPIDEKFSIFTDYGIKTGPNNEDYIYITDVFRTMSVLDKDLFVNIQEICVYSYQLGENLNFYEDIDLFKSEFSNVVNLTEFETSITFNKRIGSRLYNFFDKK